VGPAGRKIIMKKRSLVACVSIVTVPTLFLAGTAFAQNNGAAGGLCEGDALSKMFCANDLPTMLNEAFKISISVGAILAMLRIGYAGYLYMGSDIWSNKGKAKEVFQNAIFGLLLLLAIWLILNQINPDILKLRLLETAPGLASGSASTPTPAPATPPPSGAFVAPNQDPSINGCGVNGCNTFDPTPLSP
jgi:hypothetical protein